MSCEGDACPMTEIIVVEVVKCLFDGESCVPATTVSTTSTSYLTGDTAIATPFSAEEDAVAALSTESKQPSLVGGIVGGIVAFLVLVVVFLFLLRRRRTSSQRKERKLGRYSQVHEGLNEDSPPPMWGRGTATTSLNWSSAESVPPEDRRLSPQRTPCNPGMTEVETHPHSTSSSALVPATIYPYTDESGIL